MPSFYFVLHWLLWLIPAYQWCDLMGVPILLFLSHIYQDERKKNIVREDPNWVISFTLSHFLKSQKKHIFVLISFTYFPRLIFLIGPSGTNQSHILVDHCLIIHSDNICYVSVLNILLEYRYIYKWYLVYETLKTFKNKAGQD